MRAEVIQLWPDRQAAVISQTGELTPVRLPDRFLDPNVNERELIIASLISASDYLDNIVSTEHIDEVSARIHEQWRETKREAQANPHDPYIGYGSQRIKVRDLDEETKRSFAIPNDAPQDADIYHPLDKSYDDLSQDTKNKNAIPAIVLCNVLGDIVLDESALLTDLENTVRDLLEGLDPDTLELLKKIHHIAFMAGEARIGSRGYGANQRNDFTLYGSLSDPVKELDGTTILPVAEWMMGELQQTSNKQNTESNERDDADRMDEIALALFWLVDYDSAVAGKSDEEFLETAIRFISRDVILDGVSGTSIMRIKDLMVDQEFVAINERGALIITDKGRIKALELTISRQLVKTRQGYYPQFAAEIFNRKEIKAFKESYPHLAHLI